MGVDGGSGVMVGVLVGVNVGSGVDVTVGTLVAVAVAVGCAAIALQEVTAAQQINTPIRQMVVFISSICFSQ